MRNFKAIDLTLGAIFVCLMSIGANIATWLPFLSIPIGGTSVPLSLQTFFAILAGLILGRKLGSLSMIVYIFLGIAGVPVFANMQAGPMAIINPTGGFIISFVFIALVVGFIMEKVKKTDLLSLSFISTIGIIVNYSVGVTYMYISMNTWLNLSAISYKVAWISMLPFLIKDLALAMIASLFVLQVKKRISFIQTYPNSIKNK